MPGFTTSAGYPGQDVGNPAGFTVPERVPMIRGTMPGMVPGTVLGHEGVGVVETVGSAVRGFRPGDRVVIPSTLCCGNCSYCRAGYTSQCDRVNPNGPAAGTAR